MEQTTILWKPHKGQLQIIRNKARFKVIVCGRRFGKTTLAINELLKEALNTKDGLFWYVAPTYRQAKMIAWDMLLKQLRVLPKSLVQEPNSSDLSVIIGNNSKIVLKGADNEDSLRGVGLNGIVLDEYADIKPIVWREVIQPALIDKKGWAIFIGTPKGYNHFYDLFEEAGKLEDWANFKFTSYDNPTIDFAEIEKFKAQMSEDSFAQEFLAEFRKLSGLVYKEFSREKHVVNDINKSFPETIAGQDFGYTNPFGLLVIGKDYDGTYWILDERYERHKTNNEIIEIDKNAQAKYNINRWYPDPAEPDRIEEMRRAGLNCREVNKDVSAGVDRVRDLFKQNKIRIHQRCKNLIWELETYRYPEKREKNNEKEIPIKESDHLVDALRYALFTDEPIRKEIQDIEIGLYAHDYS